MNYAKDRIDNDIAPVFPSNDIVCKTCKNRRAGVIGYKNRYCMIYGDGKPTEILYDNKPCEFYRGE